MSPRITRGCHTPPQSFRASARRQRVIHDPFIALLTVFRGIYRAAATPLCLGIAMYSLSPFYASLHGDDQVPVATNAAPVNSAPANATPLAAPEQEHHFYIQQY